MTVRSPSDAASSTARTRIVWPPSQLGCDESKVSTSERCQVDPPSAESSTESAPGPSAREASAAETVTYAIVGSDGSWAILTT